MVRSVGGAALPKFHSDLQATWWSKMDPEPALTIVLLVRDAVCVATVSSSAQACACAVLILPVTPDVVLSACCVCLSLDNAASPPCSTSWPGDLDETWLFAPSRQHFDRSDQLRGHCTVRGYGHGHSYRGAFFWSSVSAVRDLDFSGSARRPGWTMHKL